MKKKEKAVKQDVCKQKAGGVELLRHPRKAMSFKVRSCQSMVASSNCRGKIGVHNICVNPELR